MNKKREHIEFFAGCGGLALGMEAAGFHLKMANEISPMASETFAYNILGEELNAGSEKVKWIHSGYDEKDINRRLRENLLQDKAFGFCDLTKDSDVTGSLLVGDIRKLKDFLFECPEILAQIEGVDLISGGPPCQSFSLAGKRERRNYKNKLPLVFAELCGMLKPRIVLLENVKGILAPFKENGLYYHAWIEVSKAFALEGFVPVCMLINSKYFGIPQNRPRFIMTAIRKDVFDQLEAIIPSEVSRISKNFFALVTESSADLNNIGISDFKYFNMESKSDIGYFDGNWLPRPLTLKESQWKSVNVAVDDLKDTGMKRMVNDQSSDYVDFLGNLFNQHRMNASEKEILNHEPRNHTSVVKSRFRYFQLLNKINGTKASIIDYVSRIEEDAALTKKISSLFESVQGEVVLMPNGNKVTLSSRAIWIKYLNSIKGSKKHSQKALNSQFPAPAQLTIPDDMCHYDSDNPRVLTVREMARIQSFPDWFVFKSKTTTGGKNRKFEVPQYTQVGNAVPPVLSYHLGRHITGLLALIEQD